MITPAASRAPGHMDNTNHAGHRSHRRGARSGGLTRDGGRDRAAWHGDTIGRGSTEDTMVAIIPVGARHS